MPVDAIPPRHGVDPAFTDLPLVGLADAALSAATAAGAAFADFRFERLLTSSLTVRDTAVQSAADAMTTGFAVRVIVDGTWGFAAAVELTPDEAAAHRPAGGRRGPRAGRRRSPNRSNVPTSRCTPTHGG